MSQPLPIFYSAVAVVHRETHRAMGVRGGGFAFARGSHLVPCVMEEFAAAAREAPILFAREGAAFVPVLLVGLRQGVNAFVDAEGRWRGRYQPAYLRRWPFIVGESPGTEPLLCVDPAGLTENSAEPLFDAAGAPTAALDRARQLAGDFAAATRVTETMTETLAELGLFEPVQVKTRASNGEQFLAEGLFAVSEAKLHALDDEVFLSLRRSSALVPIYAHLFSLGLVEALAERVITAPSAGT